MCTRAPSRHYGVFTNTQTFEFFEHSKIWDVSDFSNIVKPRKFSWKVQPIEFLGFSPICMGIRGEQLLN